MIYIEKLEMERKANMIKENNILEKHWKLLKKDMERIAGVMTCVLTYRWQER